MQLNKLQRIGIIASIIWVLGAAYHERSKQMDAADSTVSFLFKTCLEAKSHDECFKEQNHHYEVFLKPNWGNIAFFALAPIPLAWFFVFIVIRAFRWVKSAPV